MNNPTSPPAHMERLYIMHPTGNGCWNLFRHELQDGPPLHHGLLHDCLCVADPSLTPMLAMIALSEERYTPGHLFIYRNNWRGLAVYIDPTGTV